MVSCNEPSKPATNNKKTTQNAKKPGVKKANKKKKPDYAARLKKAIGLNDAQTKGLRAINKKYSNKIKAVKKAKAANMKVQINNLNKQKKAEVTNLLGPALMKKKVAYDKKQKAKKKAAKAKKAASK